MGEVRVIRASRFWVTLHNCLAPEFVPVVLGKLPCHGLSGLAPYCKVDSVACGKLVAVIQHEHEYLHAEIMCLLAFMKLRTHMRRNKLVEAAEREEHRLLFKLKVWAIVNASQLGLREER